MRKPTKIPDRPEADADIEWPPEIIWALKGIESGTATPHQQHIGLSYVLLAICRMNASAWSPRPEERDFLAGRRWVGIQIMRAVAMKPDEIIARFGRGADPSHPDNRPDEPQPEPPPTTTGDPQ